MSLLSIRSLSLEIYGEPILKNISLSLERGQVLGVIGESGSGKSMTANAIMQLLPKGSDLQGQILLNGEEIIAKTETEMTRVRGKTIGMVFQEPMTALNPVQSIGEQVAEAFLQHRSITKAEALLEARDVLARVEMPEDRFPLSRFPHELSGGQRQRVVIAMAIANSPDLLIADEPTTALDVTTQAQILKLLKRLVTEEGIGLMLISHDLAVVADMADKLVIMESGKLVDGGDTRVVLKEAPHAYTQILIAALNHCPPRQKSSALVGEVILSAKQVTCSYRLPRKHILAQSEWFRAVDQVSFDIRRGESLGLVGESGCGKSTLTRALLGLEPVRDGEVLLEGKPLFQKGKISRISRRLMQVVFQDPYASFNPRHKVARLITEPFHLLETKPNSVERDQRIKEALGSVNLPESAAEKYIHEFSGGQRQRIAIARAIINRPELIILDEAVSALDVSIRAQILDLLADLSDRFALSYLFISHDLSVVRNITDRVMIMQAGKILEEGETRAVFDAPRHDYTKTLIDAVPRLDAVLA